MATIAHISSAIALIGLVFAAPTVVRGQEPGKAAGSPSQIERGKYLVVLGGCNDCHTPWVMTEKGPAPDMKRALSGHPADIEVPPPPKPVGPWTWFGVSGNTAFSGPWGTSYAANLTPDKKTGIGQWSLDEFKETLRTGRHLGKGRPILPPMPWPNYAQATDQDLEAIFTYLQSLPPVANKVPRSTPSPPPGPRSR